MTAAEPRPKEMIAHTPIGSVTSIAKKRIAAGMCTALVGFLRRTVENDRRKRDRKLP